MIYSSTVFSLSFSFPGDLYVLFLLSGWSWLACDSFCDPYYCIWRSSFSYCWQSEWYALICLLCKKGATLFEKDNTSFPSYCFVGTLGYVMSELEEGKRFSEVVKTAKSLGYTEPGLADIL